ncbi:MAG TPA: hypothetical protein VKE69_14925 [Planctomycetota bacterium]|nr:hypothetical protein [Planctomycetota bacterium]
MLPAARESSDPASSAGAVATPAELRLLDFIGEDLADRARAIRTALRAMPDSGDAGHGALERAIAEVELLDELASSVNDLVLQARQGGEPEPIDLVEPFRRARARFADRPGGPLPVRISSPASSVLVLAHEAALVRTIALCLEASALSSDVGGAIHVHVGEEGERVRATFRGAKPAPGLPARLGERVRSSLAIASRLARTFGGEVDLARDGERLVPRLGLLAARA